MAPIFDRRDTESAYDRWLDPPALHEEDGCAECHAAHLEEGKIAADCARCDEEKCVTCFGTGQVSGEECQACQASGRII